MCLSHTRTYKHKLWVQKGSCVRGYVCVPLLHWLILISLDPSLHRSLSTHAFVYIYHHVHSPFAACPCVFTQQGQAWVDTRGQRDVTSFWPSCFCLHQTLPCPHIWPYVRTVNAGTLPVTRSEASRKQGAPAYSKGGSPLTQDICWRGCLVEKIEGCLQSFLCLSYETQTWYSSPARGRLTMPHFLQKF